MSERFDRPGIPSTKRYLREFGWCQLFVDDPNRLTIEPDYFGVDHEPNWSSELQVRTPAVDERHVLREG